MKQKKMNYRALLLAVIFMSFCAVAQGQATAVPFLSITPDARSGGMGDAGVATTSDVNSQFHNPAKYAFANSYGGASASYSLEESKNLAYLSGYSRIDMKNLISGSLRYLSLRDLVSNVEGSKDFAVDMAYTRLLGEKLAASVVGRYIWSDIGVVSEAFHSGNAFATDVAFYYHNQWNKKYNRQLKVFSVGMNISNIGNKISYTDGVEYFIPTLIRLGMRYGTDLNDHNFVSFTTEARKLLVSNGGFDKDLQGINFSAGIEYWYNDQFALRVGHHYEEEDRSFLSAGAGINLGALSLDASYQMPVGTNNPLEDGFRFTLSLTGQSISSCK